jgi:hypothetical protein
LWALPCYVALLCYAGHVEKPIHMINSSPCAILYSVVFCNMIIKKIPIRFWILLCLHILVKCLMLLATQWRVLVSSLLLDLFFHVNLFQKINIFVKRKGLRSKMNHFLIKGVSSTWDQHVTTKKQYIIINMAWNSFLLVFGDKTNFNLNFHFSFISYVKNLKTQVIMIWFGLGKFNFQPKHLILCIGKGLCFSFQTF